MATFIYMPLLVGAVSYPFWYSFALQIGEIDHSFYEVSAQINPVLLLAILVDVRRCRSLESQDLLGTIVALIGGEIVALYGAAGAPIGRPGYATVSASLTVGFVALLMAVIADYEPGGGHQVDELHESQTISDTGTSDHSKPAPSPTPHGQKPHSG